MRKMLEVTFGGEDVILTNESQIKKIARDGFLEGAEFIGVSPITMQK